MSNNKDLLPWGWSITADDATVSCPSSSAILGTLAAVNLVVSILGIIFGNRRILNWLTCRCFFNDPDSHAYRWTWMINVGLQLGANVAIAYIFQKAPGYNADFEIWELMLFFTVRPRLSWIALGLLGPLSSQKGKKITVQRRLPMKGRAARRRAHRSQTPEVEDVWVHDFPWRNSAIAQVLAEIALQCIALYIMGRSAHFGVQKGFYKINNDLPSAARLMYAGAMYYLITGTGMLIYEFIWLARTIRQEISDQDYALSLGFFVVANLFTTWTGSWIFWAGFVHLAGSLYCPPKLYAQGTIWGAFSLAGIVIGGGGA